MTIKVPAFLADHPVESLIAVALLLGLLFISADGSNPLPSQALIVTAARN